MVRFLLFVGLLGGGLTLGQGACAATMTNAFRIGNWSGGSYSKEQSKQFDHCRAGASNAGGITIGYAVNRERWSLTFSNAAWNFANGLSLNLVLKMGEHDIMRGHAVAIDKQMLEVQVDDNIALFARLRVGGQLQVTAGGLVFEFQLVDSDDVLSALSQCVMRQTGLAQNSKPKRAGDKAQPLFTADLGANEEAKALAAEILGFARIPEARMSAPGEGDPRAAAVWKAGLVTGAISVLGASEAFKIADVPDKLIDVEARKCQGGFFFISELDSIDLSPVARIFTSCKTPEAVISVYHLAVPRPSGGAFLVSSTSKGGGFGGTIQRMTEQVDARVRSVVTAALKKLGQLEISRP